MGSTRRALVPLQAQSKTVLVLALFLVLYASLPFIIAPQRFHDMATVDDFANYWSAGATVGTHVLTNYALLAAWQGAHHLAAQPFVYPPAFAWIYRPFSWLPPMAGFVAEQVIMALLFCACAAVAARIYGFKLWFAIAAVFAWGPTMCTIESGQNTGLSLLLNLGAIFGLVTGNKWLLGSSIGLLLFKPTDAAVMILLVLARREWRALAMIGAFALFWFVSSVYAAGSDWYWPITYAHTVRDWYALHSGANPYMVFTLPTILLAHGIPEHAVFASSLALLLLSVPLLARAPALVAGSLAPLLGLAAAVHAWSYAAALILPALFFVMTSVPNPQRTRLIALIYALGGIGVAMSIGGLALTVVCLGGAGWALWTAYKPSGYVWGNVASAKVSAA
ncbi:MAG TPA: glycosyltransferase family 87 protein [Xanthobacteraceae bacterium]